MIKTTTKKFTSQARTENILGGLLLLKIKNLHLGSDRLANIQWHLRVPLYLLYINLGGKTTHSEQDSNNHLRTTFLWTLKEWGSRLTSKIMWEQEPWETGIQWVTMCLLTYSVGCNLTKCLMLLKCSTSTNSQGFIRLHLHLTTSVSLDLTTLLSLFMESHLVIFLLKY